MIEIIIADDSFFLRKILKESLEATGKIKVKAVAKNGREAIELVKQHKPDILILDCEMPIMDGIETLKIIMKENSLPVFMFSSLTCNGADITIKALECGAVDFLLKPSGGIKELNVVINEMVRKLTFIVLQQKINKKDDIIKYQPSSLNLVKKIKSKKIDIVGIGSSTGGVKAATEVISKFPKNMMPIVWVQHMPSKFTKSFAERLNNLSEMYVKEACDKEKIERGVCYLAPGGYQMRLIKKNSDYFIQITDEDKVSGHSPSCNVLFNSLEKLFTHNILGIILTGMGEDGADGLKKMHDKGAYVIGQNQKSCVVYGMPRAAYEKGAVDIELDISDIAGAILKKVQL